MRGGGGNVPTISFLFGQWWWWWVAWCLGSGGGWHGVWVVVVVAWCLGSGGGGMVFG